MTTQKAKQALSEVRKVSMDLRQMSATLERTRNPNTAGVLARLARKLGLAEASLDHHINAGDNNETTQEAEEA